MPSDHDFTRFCVADFVIEHDFRRLARAVNDGDFRLHAVNQRAFVLESEFHNRFKEPLAVHHQVFKAILRAKGFAGILEIDGIMSMPHHAHRVDLAEADVEGLGYRKCFSLFHGVQSCESMSINAIFMLARAIISSPHLISAFTIVIWNNSSMTSIVVIINSPTFGVRKIS